MSMFHGIDNFLGIDMLGSDEQEHPKWFPRVLQKYSRFYKNADFEINIDDVKYVMELLGVINPEIKELLRN